jgi:acyl-CoA dehydrogenase
VNLDFSDDQKMLKGELARYLSSREPRKGFRAALDGLADHDAELWLELGELGWLSVAIPSEYGGPGLGHDMLCCVAEELGRSMAAIPLESSIFLVVEALLLFGTEAQKSRWLPELGKGRCIGAFAIAEGPGAVAESSIACTVSVGRLSGTKVAVADGAICDLMLVVALEGAEPRLFLVDANDRGVTRTRQTGIDPSHVPALVKFDSAAAEPLGESGIGWSAVRRLLDRAAVLFAFAQVGSADAALQISLDFAKERKAFGRLIGSFQALKHKLADVWIGNELARANSYYAAWVLQGNRPELPLAAATARISACEALESAARELIQVHGGIAVTWEHDAHLFYRRAQHLALMLGGPREWQGQVVKALAENTTGAH